MARRAYAEISKEALRHNYQLVKTFAPNSKVLAMVKANAYGHGLISVAKTLTEADGFGVASLDEALVLRQAGITQEIFLMEGFFHEDELDFVQDCQLTVVINQFQQIDRLHKLKANHSSLPVWLKMNTGMNRLGFLPQDFDKALNAILQNPALSFQGFMTHFAKADESNDSMTNHQIQLFNELVGSHQGARSLANSAGIIAWPQSHADWVRPGLMLYGASPLNNRSASDLKLKPVMCLKAEINAIQPVSKGATVGYGGTWQASDERHLIAMVTIGYGDGYPWHAQTGTPVLVNGQPCQVVGRVSMDMLAVDVSHLKQPATVGDTVTLWGPQLPIEAVASAAQTISYEVFCKLTSRIRHVLVDKHDSNDS